MPMGSRLKYAGIFSFLLFMPLHDKLFVTRGALGDMEACGLEGFYTPAQRERWNQAVSRRASVRAFGAPPDVARRSALEYAAARVCLPGVRIALTACESKELFIQIPLVTRITGATRCAVIIADMRVTDAAVRAGVSGEAFILEATSLNVATCWVSGSFRRGACSVALKEGEKILAVTPLGEIAQDASPRARKRKTLGAICTSDPAGWPLWAYNAAESVRVAPSAMNMQPWRLTYAGRTLMLSARGGSKLDFGIAMLHMEASVGARPHHWQRGDQNDTVLLIVEDKNDAV